MDMTKCFVAQKEARMSCPVHVALRLRVSGQINGSERMSRGCYAMRGSDSHSVLQVRRRNCGSLFILRTASAPICKHLAQLEMSLSKCKCCAMYECLEAVTEGTRQNFCVMRRPALSNLLTFVFKSQMSCVFK